MTKNDFVPPPPKCANDHCPFPNTNSRFDASAEPCKFSAMFGNVRKCPPVSHLPYKSIVEDLLFGIILFVIYDIII